MLKVVIDTNVLVSALLVPSGNPALIVSLILKKQIKLCLSNDISLEYQGVLDRKKFDQLDKGTVQKLISQIKKDALWIKPHTSVDAIKEDPGDNKFLECVLEAEADFFITGNIKHFSFKKFHSTLIVTPSEFLYIIASRDVF